MVDGHAVNPERDSQPLADYNIRGKDKIVDTCDNSLRDLNLQQQQ
jgi:hypothetical protein